MVAPVDVTPRSLSRGAPLSPYIGRGRGQALAVTFLYGHDLDRIELTATLRSRSTWTARISVTWTEAVVDAERDAVSVLV